MNSPNINSNEQLADWVNFPHRSEWDCTRRSVLHYINDAESRFAKLRSLVADHDYDNAPDVTQALFMCEQARIAREYANDCDTLLTDHCKELCPKAFEDSKPAQTYELKANPDGSIQLRLTTSHGLVDLVFSEREQVLRFVAGQHLEAAKKVLVELSD